MFGPDSRKEIIVEQFTNSTSKHWKPQWKKWICDLLQTATVEFTSESALHILLKLSETRNKVTRSCLLRFTESDADDGYAKLFAYSREHMGYDGSQTTITTSDKSCESDESQDARMIPLNLWFSFLFCIYRRLYQWPSEQVFNAVRSRFLPSLSSNDCQMRNETDAKENSDKKIVETVDAAY